MFRFRELIAAALVAAAVAPCSAGPLLVAYDNSAGGTTAIVGSPTSPDGNGSLQLNTPSGERSAAILYLPGLAPLGKLGDLTAATFDYLRSSVSTTGTSSSPAFRFYTNQGLTLGLVWELVYQTQNSVNSDQWQDDVNVFDGKLWQRGVNTSGTRQNFDTFPNFKTLNEWEAGYTPVGSTTSFSANTQIYGIGLSFGSGIPNNFLGYVDDVKVTFGTGAPAITYTGNFALAPVPEPATVAVFGLMAACGGAYVRRRKLAAA